MPYTWRNKITKPDGTYGYDGRRWVKLKTQMKGGALVRMPLQEIDTRMSAPQTVMEERRKVLAKLADAL